MKFNNIVLQQDYALAFKRMRDGIVMNKGGSVIQIPEDNISAPATIVQELAYVNTQSTYNFQFGNTNSVVGTNILNNQQLGQNNAMVIAGFFFSLGYGATVPARQYFSRGQTAADNSIYNGKLQLKLESNTPVDLVDMRHFYEEGDFIDGSGYVSIKPLRILTGAVATFQVSIVLPQPITGLNLSSDLFLSMRPFGAIGFA